jgi:soluble lytic murein transglycosylase-like protein
MKLQRQEKRAVFFALFLGFLIGAVLPAYAPDYDPYGYVYSNIEFWYAEEQEDNREKEAEKILVKMQNAREEWNEKYKWYSRIPEEYREFVINLNEEELHIPPALIYYLVRWESGWYPKATGYNLNGTRDLGLMQLNSRYVHAFVAAHFSGNPEDFDPYNPEHNLEVGLKHLNFLHGYFNDWKSAVQAYNAGKGRIAAGYVPGFAKHYASMTYEKAHEAGGITNV